MMGMVCQKCLKEAHCVNPSRKVEGCVCHCHEYEERMRIAQEELDRNHEAFEKLKDECPECTEEEECIGHWIQRMDEI